MGKRPLKDPNEYNVGYRKPPKQHQFEKGKSGNPLGKIPTSTRLDDMLSAQLNKIVVVKDKNGRATRISRYELMLSSLVSQAVTSLPAFNIVVRLMQRYRLDSPLDSDFMNFDWEKDMDETIAKLGLDEKVGEQREEQERASETASQRDSGEWAQSDTAGEVKITKNNGRPSVEPTGT